MRSPLLVRVVGWLLPDDERGSATQGDLEEVHRLWADRRGTTIASLLLVTEVARSVPGLVAAAVAERGAPGLLLRSTPAVAAGCLAVAAPYVLLGASVSLSGAGAAAIALVTGAALALGGGWLAAALAGAAPRQHGLGVGLALVLAVAALAASGRIASSPWMLGAWQLCVLAAAAAGGERHRHARRQRGRVGDARVR